MTNNIFIPKKIKVGYQNRDDTYTKRLAYVIYYDEKDILRKETSWDHWRDNKIEPDDYENIPTVGFVLNKKVGDYCCDWNHRQAYVRVYDPRNFEFEITIENLLYILQNTSSIKGKGLEGEFVYGWNGKDLILIPTCSPDYINLINRTEKIYQCNYIKAKDLKIGATYAMLGGEQYVYMGRSNYWESEKNYYGQSYRNSNKNWTHPIDDTWQEDKTKNDIKFRNVNKGNRFWFIKKDDIGYIFAYRDTKKFYSIIDENVIENFADYQDKLESNYHYSPIDYSASKIISYTFEEFKKCIDSMINYNDYDRSKSLLQYNNKSVELIKIYKNHIDGSLYYKEYNNDSPNYSIWGNNTKQVTETLEELYAKIKPVYAERYLTNGKLYEREYYYDN